MVPRVDISVEDGSAINLVLRQGALGTPVNQDISSWKNLRNTLRLGK